MISKALLELKQKIKKKRPKFRRQEGYRHARLKDVWRRPRGKHSKQRMHEKARGALPNPGYGVPKETRGLNKDGLLEVRVSNPAELSALDPKAHAAVIASGVGAKKKAEILKKAEELKIKVANARMS